MKDKIRVVSAGIITALVILTSLLFAGTLLAKGKIIDMILPIGIIVIIGLFMIPFVKRKWFDVKKGFPFEDERSKKLMNRAAAYAYYISLYWLLALSWASEEWIVFRDVSQAIGAGIIGMAIIFGICYLWVGEKGDIE